jgi:hypothetical protein
MTKISAADGSHVLLTPAPPGSYHVLLTPAPPGSYRDGTASPSTKFVAHCFWRCLMKLHDDMQNIVDCDVKHS